jgi:hypothetical protein
MTTQEIVDTCARLGVELSDWQRDWITAWIAAGRPRSLRAQYQAAVPVNAARAHDPALPRFNN